MPRFVRVCLSVISSSACLMTAQAAGAHEAPRLAGWAGQSQGISDADIAVLAKAMLPIAGDELSPAERETAVRTFQSIGPFPLMWGGWIEGDEMIGLILDMLALSEDQAASVSRSLGAAFETVRGELVAEMRRDLSAALEATRSATASIDDAATRIAAAKDVSAATARISKRLAGASARVEEMMLAEAHVLSAQQERLLPLLAAMIRQEALIVSFSYHFPGLGSRPLQSAMSEAAWGLSEADPAMLGTLYEILRPGIEERGAAVSSFESAYIDHFSVATWAEAEMALEAAVPDRATRTRYESTRRRLSEAARRVAERNLDMCIALAAIGDGMGRTSGVRLWARASRDLGGIVQGDWISLRKAAMQLHVSGLFAGEQHDEFTAFAAASEEALLDLVAAYLDEVQAFHGTGSYGRQQRARVGPRLGRIHERFDRACANAAMVMQEYLESDAEGVIDIDARREMRRAATGLSELFATRSHEGFYDSSPWVTQVPR